MTTAEAKNPISLMITAHSRVIHQGIMRYVRVPKKLVPLSPKPAHVPVIVYLGDDQFESTLSPSNSTSYRLVIPVAYLRERGIETGGRLDFAFKLSPERAAPTLPADVEKSFRDDGKTLDAFRSLTVNLQRQLLRYAELAVSPRVREERVELIGLRARERMAKKSPPKRRAK